MPYSTFRKVNHAAHDSRSLNHGPNRSGSVQTSRIVSGGFGSALAFRLVAVAIVVLVVGFGSGRARGEVIGQRWRAGLVGGGAGRDGLQGSALGRCESDQGI